MLRSHRFRPVLVAVVVLAAVGLVAASASGGGDRTGAGEGKRRPTTVLVAPSRWGISELRADGRRLVWMTETGRSLLKLRPVIQVFDRRSGRLTTIPEKAEKGWAKRARAPGSELLALANGRLIEARAYEGDTRRAAVVFSAPLRARRLHRLNSFAMETTRGYSDWEAIGDVFGFPVRVASGGGTLAFFGADTSKPTPLFRVWRLEGLRARRVPYQPPLTSSVAVDGRRLASLELVTTGLDAEPAWSPDGREIAWYHSRWPYAWPNEQGEIWLMGADGSNQHRLVDGSNPIWSPNGTTLALQSRDGIDLVARDGSNRRHLADGFDPAWSPDGSTLAFLRRHDPTSKSAERDVWLIGADSSGLRRLTSDGLAQCLTLRSDLGNADEAPGRNHRCLAWAPDGKTLAISAGGERSRTTLLGRTGGIALIDIASGSARTLISDMGDLGPPAWSPDGSWIAFAGHDKPPPAVLGWGGPEFLYLVRPDGTGFHKLAPDYVHPAEVEPLTWSPDGTQVAYNGSQVAKVDGTGLTTLKHEDVHALAGLVWSPDGKTLVAGDALPDYRNGGIEALDFAGGPTRWLTPKQTTRALELRDIRNGKLLRRWQLPWQRGADTYATDYDSLALSGRYLIATYWRPDSGYVLERYDTKSGALLERTRLRQPLYSGISLAGRSAVYSLGRRVFLLDAKTGHRSPLVSTRYPVAPIIAGKHVLWYENRDIGTTARHYRSLIREIVLP